MRRTFGAALVAAAIVFVGCGGDSDTTPRAFGTEGPVEGSWNDVQPIVDRIETRATELTDEDELIEDARAVVQALENDYFSEGRYERVRRLAAKADQHLTELLGDGSLLVRVRELARDLREYTLEPFDDDTVTKAVGWANDITTDVEDTLGNNAVQSLRNTTDEMVAWTKSTAGKVKGEQVVAEARELILTLDQRVDRALEDGGSLDELYAWTLDLVNAVKELIKP